MPHLMRALAHKFNPKLDANAKLRDKYRMMNFEVVDLLHYSSRSFGIRCLPRLIIVLGNIANLGCTIQRGELFIILFS